ncbi:MAG: glycosyltransferase family 1 protein, partial [Devosia sp.]
MKIVYWASSGDRLRAEQAAQTFQPSSGRWLRDFPDNRSDAPVAQIFASLSQCRGALAALVAASESGKTTVFTPLIGSGELRAARPEIRSLLTACAAASDGVHVTDAESAKALKAIYDDASLVDLSQRPPPHPDFDVRRIIAAASSGMILFDLTTSLMSTGPQTGIARIQYALYAALMEIAPERIIPIVWHRQTNTYLRLPIGLRADPVASELLGAMESEGRARPLDTEDIAQGSQFLITGGTWARRGSMVEALARARLRCAAHVTVLIHDLAQIEHPELYPDTAGMFERNARRLLEVADRVLVYSDATRADVAGLLADVGPFKPIAKFQVGSTLSTAPASQIQSQRVPVGLEACAGKRVVLYVSSIEPRKNHRMLIEVWRRLITARGESAPMLLCVGRPFMGGKQMIHDVRADTVLNSHVHFATGLSDADLDWCYRSAVFTVYPSLYEGWGLPIAESLLYGKFCITSNTSSMREVAPRLTDLLDPRDVVSWLDRISFYLDNPRELSTREERIREEHATHPWESSALEVLGVMSALPSLFPPTAYVQPFA